VQQIKQPEAEVKWQSALLV